MVPPPKTYIFAFFTGMYSVFGIFGDLFFWAFLNDFWGVFTNVYKRYGSIAADLDPRSKILGKTSWIQGLDPRSKIQDSRKNFLDPRSGSKIQDPRF